MKFEYFYSVIVTAAILTVYLLVKAKIHKEELIKRKFLRLLVGGDPIETESPVSDNESVLREAGLQGLEQRFGFLNRALPIFAFALWTLFMIVPYLGALPTIYISIVTAVFSVAVGIAFRPFLENLFAGVVISFFKSMRVGDTVIVDGEYGIVEQIGLTYSVIKKWNWTRFVIPNFKMIQKEVQNLTLSDEYIWAHIEFYVDPEADLELVRDLAIESALDSPHFNSTEEPSFWVMELQRDAVLCWLAAWADTPSDAWELRAAIRYTLARKLKEKNIRLHAQYFKGPNPHKKPAQLDH